MTIYNQIRPNMESYTSIYDDIQSHMTQYAIIYYCDQIER